MLLSPIFFASIGIKVSLPDNMSTSIIIFSVLLLVVAVLSKVLGCGLGAKLCKFSNRESLQIGCGMVSRGEVALIVASKGEALGLMSSVFFGPVVIVVVVTTILAPILLKITFKKRKKKQEPSMETEPAIKTQLVDDYEEMLKYTTGHVLVEPAEDAAEDAESKVLSKKE